MAYISLLNVLDVSEPPRMAAALNSSDVFTQQIYATKLFLSVFILTAAATLSTTDFQNAGINGLLGLR